MPRQTPEENRRNRRCIKGISIPSPNSICSRIEMCASELLRSNDSNIGWKTRVYRPLPSPVASIQRLPKTKIKHPPSKVRSEIVYFCPGVGDFRRINRILPGARERPWGVEVNHLPSCVRASISFTCCNGANWHVCDIG
jgi:hypothetical protein